MNLEQLEDLVHVAVEKCIAKDPFASPHPLLPILIVQRPIRPCVGRGIFEPHEHRLDEVWRLPKTVWAERKELESHLADQDPQRKR